MVKNNNQKTEEIESKDEIESETTEVLIDATEDFEGFLAENTDAQEYLAICTITGKKTNPAQMGEYEIKSWLADMKAWVSQGKPKPKMPKVQKGAVKFATAIYRIRDQGKDKMYCYFNDGSKLGIKEIIEYEQVEDIETGDMVDSKIVKATYSAYTQNFSAEKCKKLILEADDLMKPGQSLQLYFWYNGLKKSISPDNIMLSYEKIADMIREKKPLN